VEGKELAVDERSRLAMRRRLEEVLGEEHAATLMEYLSPELATKKDLEGLEHRLTLRIRGVEGLMDGVEGRMDGLEGRIDGFERNMSAMEQRLNERIDLKIESSEHRLHSAIDNLATSVAKDMVAQTRRFIFATLGALAAMAALAFAPVDIG
jgi:hypothetical protein